MTGFQLHERTQVRCVDSWRKLDARPVHEYILRASSLLLTTELLNGTITSRRTKKEQYLPTIGLVRGRCTTWRSIVITTRAASPGRAPRITATPAIVGRVSSATRGAAAVTPVPIAPIWIPFLVPVAAVVPITIRIPIIITVAIATIMGIAITITVGPTMSHVFTWSRCMRAICDWVIHPDSTSIEILDPTQRDSRYLKQKYIQPHLILECIWIVFQSFVDESTLSTIGTIAFFPTITEFRPFGGDVRFVWRDHGLSAQIPVDVHSASVFQQTSLVYT